MKPALLRQLGGPLMLFLLVASIIAGGVVYTEGAEDEAENRRTSQQQILSGARARKANAGLEKDLITRFGPVYKRLEDVGFIGTEQRLDWVDSLRTANRDAHLYGVEYQIGQQEPFPAAVLGASGLQMRQSPMRVKLQLLHEGDLIDFLRRVADSRRGVFTMSGCTLTRITNTVTAEQPNVNAECDLNWITVEEPASGAPAS
jgi:hypothetical protein